MFGLFQKLSIKRDMKDRELVFQLSHDVEVIIGVNEPPMFSRGYLCVNGKKLADVNVSIHPDKVEKLQHYADSVRPGNMDTNKSFLERLNELGFTTFVEKIEKYTDKDYSCGSSMNL